jgi:acyl-CoA thioester hydrolase
VEILKDFVIKTKFPIDWGDMDAMQHINNVVFLKYFENSRIQYYEAIGLSYSTNLGDFLGVVKSISCEYLIPLTFPDIIEVGTRVIDMDNHSFTMEHYIWSNNKGLCAFGETRIVVIDVKTLKPITVPDKVKKAIERIEQKLFNYGIE